MLAKVTPLGALQMPRRFKTPCTTNQRGILSSALSSEGRDKIRKERDKKGEQGGSKRAISELLTTKQLTTAIISSIQKANSNKTEETSPTTSNSMGNSFGGHKSAKRNKTDLLSAVRCFQTVAAYHTTERRHQISAPRSSIASISHNKTNTARCELDSHADTCVVGANFVSLHLQGGYYAVFHPTMPTPTALSATFKLLQRRQRIPIKTADRPTSSLQSMKACDLAKSCPTHY